jgi:hypothetical protein
VRGWGYGKTKAVFSLGKGAGSAAGSRAPGRVRDPVGRDEVDRREDGVLTGDVEAVDEEG